jgi:hypothetical protein
MPSHSRLSLSVSLSFLQCVLAGLSRPRVACGVWLWLWPRCILHAVSIACLSSAVGAECVLSIPFSRTGTVPLSLSPLMPCVRVGAGCTVSSTDSNRHKKAKSAEVTALELRPIALFLLCTRHYICMPLFLCLFVWIPTEISKVSQAGIDLKAVFCKLFSKLKRLNV